MHIGRLAVTPFGPRRGFTTLELVLALGVVASLAASGTVYWGKAWGRQRVEQASQALWQSLQLARQQAMLRQQTVSLCRSNDGQRCLSVGQGWHLGWIVFVNLDGDSPAQRDPNEPILSVQTGFATGVTVQVNQNFTHFLSYDRSGQANNLGTWVVCWHNQAVGAQAIVVTRTRLAFATDGNGNRVPETPNGNGLADLNGCHNP